ncbi:ferritin family protein [Caenispirillum salinarum]
MLTETLVMAQDTPPVTFDSVPAIERPEDLFAVATAMEREAARRYDQLAERMDDIDVPDLAALFRRLKAMESEHEEGIQAWASRAEVEPEQRLSFTWDMAEGIAEAALADAGGAESLTSYKALQLAVRNEERAFAFYANVAAKSSDPTVREYAERMADEELHHVALLRLERRHAWRAEHGGSSPSQAPDVETVEDLAAWLADRDAEAAARHRMSAAVARLSGDPQTAALLEDQAARRDPQAAPATDADLGDAVSLVQMLRHEIRLANEEYDMLMRVVDRAQDEAVLALAQETVAGTIARLAALRDRTAALEAASARDPRV